MASTADIRPFDLLAFSGSGLISQGIALAERLTTGAGDFTHVGMAVRAELLPHFPQLEKGKVYILESKCKTGPGRPLDAITGEDIMGVSLRDLEAVLAVSSSRVAWCPLKENPWEDPAGREALVASFAPFFAHYHRMSYEMDALSMVAAVLPAARPAREARDSLAHAVHKGGEKISHLFHPSREEEERGTFRGDPSDWQFCSELVARAWQAVGILGPEVDPRNALPIDFFGCDLDKGGNGLKRIVGEPVDLPTSGKPTILY